LAIILLLCSKEVGRTDWALIIQQAAQASGLKLELLQQELLGFGERLRDLPDFMQQQTSIPLNIRDRFSLLCQTTSLQLRQVLHG